MPASQKPCRHNKSDFIRPELKPARQRHQPIHQRQRHAPLSFGARMQPVGVFAVYVWQLLRDHGIDTAVGVKVDHGHRPHVAGFLNSVDVAVEVFSAHVLPALVGLYVLVAELGVCAVQRRKQHYLLVGKQLFQSANAHVYPSFQRLVGHYGHASFARVNLLFAVNGSRNGVRQLLEPFADRHSRVEVVGAYEHHYSVNLIAVFAFQRLRLPRDVVPLPAADAVNVGSYAKHVLQEAPVFLLYVVAVVVRVGYRVTQIAHAKALPRVADTARGKCVSVVRHYTLRHAVLRQTNHKD